MGMRLDDICMLVGLYIPTHILGMGTLTLKLRSMKKAI